MNTTIKDALIIAGCGIGGALVGIATCEAAFAIRNRSIKKKVIQRLDTLNEIIADASISLSERDDKIRKLESNLRYMVCSVHSVSMSEELRDLIDKRCEEARVKLDELRSQAEAA